MSQTSSLLDVVRQATCTAHRALESRLDLNDGSWSEARYAAFLRATLSVVQHVEEPIHRHLHAAGGVLDAPTARERLAHDLERLGADASLAPALAPAIETRAQAFGGAYVLCGSLLGGQIIARTLQAHLGLDRDCFTYLQPRGVAVGDRWRAFTTGLNDFGRVASPGEWDETTGTARAMFHAFDAAFAHEGWA